jgi:hypothetical protein
MSAIEMMDRKMDSSVNAGSILTFEEMVDSGQLPPVDALKLAEAVQIVRAFLRMEAVFLEGHPFAQTVWSVYYAQVGFEAPERYLQQTSPRAPLAARFLYGCAAALVRACDLLREQVQRSEVCEEEDFVTFSYHLPSPQIPDEVLFRLLRELEDELAAAGNESGGDERAAREEAARLVRWRKCWLLALVQFERGQAEQARRNLQLARQALDALPAAAEDPDAAFSLSRLLQPELVRRLRIPCVPKPLRATPEWAEARDRLARFAQVQLEASEALQLTSLAAARSFFADAGQRETLYRARLHLCWTSGMPRRVLAQRDPLELTQAALADAGLPRSVLRQAETAPFVEACTRLHAAQLRLLCYNRARQRRRVVALMEELGNQEGGLLQLAQVADARLRPSQTPPPLFRLCTSYALELLLWAMLHWLQLGRELDLYSRYELPAVYWLAESLHARAAQLPDELATALLALRGAASKKRLQQQQQQHQQARGDSAAKLMSECQSYVARGLWRVLLAYASEGEGEFRFGDPETRFYQRFMGLYRSGVQVTAFQTWATARREVLARGSAALLREAQEAFGQARGCLERAQRLEKPLPPPALDALRRLVQLAVTNSVAIARAPPLPPAPARPAPPFLDFSLNPFFPVLKFT